MDVAPHLDTEKFMHRQVDLGELRLHCVEYGPPKGKLVVLLHGFPEFWWSWRHQLRALGDAGFHAVAPDMRGYNLSDKPHGVRAYRIQHLAADVARLVQAYGAERAHVVGHDWGGAVAWAFAMQHPERLERLAILSAPHPREMLKGFRRLEQLKKSWYMFFFQLPRVPEKWVSAADFKNVRKTFRADGMADREIDRYVDALKHPGAITAAINYYRAALRAVATRKLPDFRRIDAPVLVLWGARDRYLGKELARPDPNWVSNVRVEMFPDATHWLQHDVPEKVNSQLIDFFKPS
jgi:pimeloyl-ACP methyl ester carboxylesterase